MGNLCWMCGLDFRTVKLRTVSTFDEKGRAVQVSACDHCKDVMIKGNHPMNTQPENVGDGTVSGYVRPSSDDKPAIRPS